MRSKLARQLASSLRTVGRYHSTTTSNSRIAKPISYQTLRNFSATGCHSQSNGPAPAAQAASQVVPPSSQPRQSPPSYNRPSQPPPATTTRHDPENGQPLRSLTESLSDPPPTLAEDEKQVDWTRSFHGLSAEAFSPEAAAILTKDLEFDDIEIKPDGIIYLPEIKYRRILNKAFGPGGWGLAPRGETIVTGKTVTREYGLVAGGR